MLKVIYNQNASRIWNPHAAHCKRDIFLTTLENCKTLMKKDLQNKESIIRVEYEGCIRTQVTVYEEHAR